MNVYVRTEPLRGTPMTRYIVMVGNVAIHKQVSIPSTDDIATALRRHAERRKKPTPAPTAQPDLFRCARCHSFKTPERFHRDASTKRGVKKNCIDCSIALAAKQRGAKR